MKVVGMRWNERQTVQMMEYAKRMPSNPIKTPQNSIGTPDDKPAPLTWPSLALEIHLGYTMKKNKNGDMT